MNLTGIFFGLFTAVAIGLGFVWVIKLEYYFGARSAMSVALIGFVITLASLFIQDFKLSAIVGIVGGTLLWGATELPDQKERVALGMFPANPKRRGSKDTPQPPSIAGNIERDKS